MAEARKKQEEAANDDPMVVPVGIRPPPPTPGVRQLARAAIADAMAVLTGLMRDKDAPAATRLAAANSLLDRAGGKGEGVSAAEPRPRASEVLSSEELEYLSKLYCEGGSYPHEPQKFFVEEQSDERILLRCHCGRGYIEMVDGRVVSHHGIKIFVTEGEGEAEGEEKAKVA